MTAPDNETLTLLLIEDDAGDAFLVEELLGEANNPPKIIWVRSLAESRVRLTDGRAAACSSTSRSPTRPAWRRWSRCWRWRRTPPCSC